MSTIPQHSPRGKSLIPHRGRINEHQGEFSLQGLGDVPPGWFHLVGRRARAASERVMDNPGPAERREISRIVKVTTWRVQSERHILRRDRNNSDAWLNAHLGSCTNDSFWQ
jgi:hypothetical protein